MKRFFTKLAASVGLFGLFLVPLAVPATANAQDVTGNLCAGANFSVNDKNCDATGAEQSVETIITTVINIFSLVVGFVSVIMIIIGGFKYITSGGNEGSVSGAKNTILFAIVGLVIVALAQVIVQFVLTQATENL
jgi:cytochrome bd-type quinol oxidase subunit 2